MGNKRSSYQKTKRLTLAQQQFALLSAFPGGICETDKRNQLRWRGTPRPTPLSKEYSVNMEWTVGYSPLVWVVGDELERLDASDFPHKYEIDVEKKRVRLCLYRYQEFNSCKLLSKTIIPWTIEWLYFYEIWLATGVWCGGGEHPQRKNEKQRTSLEI